MKNKSKLVLGLSVLTAATIAAGTTGTFAWFTTNRKATVAINNVTVSANLSDLKIDVKNAFNDDTATITEATGTYSNAKTIASATTIADVSSDQGIDFTHVTFQPADQTRVQSVEDVTTVTKNFSQYYVDINNQVSGGAGKTLDLYLGEETLIAPATVAYANAESPTEAETLQDTANKSLATWSRVAINYLGATDDATAPARDADTGHFASATHKVTFKSTIAGGATIETAGKYVPTSKTSVAAGYKYNDPSGTPSESVLADATIRTDAFTEVLSNADKSGTNYLGSVAAGKHAWYLVTVWMEGTEVLNQNAAKGGIENIKLDIRAFEA